MSEENLEVLREIYDGWSRGDFSSADRFYDPDVTLVLHPELPDAGTYEGAGGIREYMGNFLDAWDDLKIVPVTMEASGDRVLVEVRQDATGKDSGAAVGFNYFQLWTLRDGRVIRLESIQRGDEARLALSS